MHPLFRPTSAEDLIVGQTAPDPAAAFTGWFDKPAQTIEEAERYVEAAAQISEKRKEFWESKDEGPQKVQEAAADVASEGIPHRQRVAAATGNFVTLPIRTGRTSGDPAPAPSSPAASSAASSSCRSQ